MYIKVREFSSMFSDLWAYYIYSDKNRVACVSEKSWRTVGGAVRAAIKLAVALGIEYREV